MISTFIAALVMGCILGPLARLILPGRQNISTGMTVLLGAVGALLGTAIGAAFLDYGSTKNLISFSGLLMGLLGALIVVFAYTAVAGRNSRAVGR